MATYTAIPDSELDPDSPVRSINGFQLRDNPIAITEGASGAPRIDSDAAIDWGGGGVGTTPGRDWVLARTAAASVGTVGTYAMLLSTTNETNNTILAAGSTKAGSTLRYANAASLNTAGVITDVSGTPAGTWRLMGAITDTDGTSNYANAASLWLRIT